MFSTVEKRSSETFSFFCHFTFLKFYHEVFLINLSLSYLVLFSLICWCVTNSNSQSLICNNLNGVYLRNLKMLTKHNIYSQKVNATEVPLELFYNIVSDIYKHVLMLVNKTVILRHLDYFFYWNYAMLDMQNKYKYGSYRVGSRTLAICKVKFFVMTVKFLVFNYSTKRSVFCICSNK